MHTSGDDDLVRDIAGHRNHARVAELAADARVVAWLGRVGLDAAEAARIQPEYCFMTVAACICGGAEVDTVAELTVVEGIGGAATAEVRAVWGEPLLAVGDRVALSGTAGATVLASYARDDRGEPQLTRQFTILGDDARITCSMTPGEHRYPGDDIVGAWLAADCEAEITKLQPGTAKSVCDEDGDAGDGCAGSGLSSTVPGALLAAWLLRRRRA